MNIILLKIMMCIKYKLDRVCEKGLKSKFTNFQKTGKTFYSKCFDYC